MRIFVAGASGVIGVRLVPLLVGAGHHVAGMTRSPDKAARLRSLGAEPVVCDVFDAEALNKVVGAFAPEVVVDQLTDLPDASGDLPEYRGRNDRMRTEGTRNLLGATRAAGANRVVAQSIAWETPDEQARAAVAQYEQSILDSGGTVVRYGQLYGPDTFFPSDPPPPPRIHVDDAARRTVPTIDAPPGVIVLTEPERDT
jgi:nucleoside-diphosphate-sugar epimerase